MDQNDLTKLRIVKDITVRAKISEYFKNAAMTSLPYEIQDGERPETLAHRIYNRSDLHWLILLFNEIHDSTFSWPFSSAELESYIANKYKGQVIYYPDTARVFGRNQVQNILLLQTAKTIHQKLSNDLTVSATIVKWNPTYNSILLEGEQAHLFDPSVLDPDKDDAYACFYLDNDKTKTLAFNRIQPHEYALNHFEDQEENVLDPRMGPPSEPTSASSILNRYVLQIGFVDVVSIDNRTQEFRINEKKRLIRVVKPEFLSPLLTQFRSLFI